MKIVPLKPDKSGINWKKDCTMAFPNCVLDC